MLRYSGCVGGVWVLVSQSRLARPDWTQALNIDFSRRTSLTILYGHHWCGVCSLRDLASNTDLQLGQGESGGWIDRYKP